MKKLILQIINNLKNEDVRTYRLCTYGILGIVSLVMTVMNVITNKGLLTLATALFAIFSILDMLLTVLGDRGAAVATYLFSAEFIALFTFFLISGNPDGFSVIWIVLLPMAGMFFFGTTYGSMLCAIMLFILVFFLWLPFGRSMLMYPYTETFCMRFPVLYTSAYLLSLFLATTKERSYSRMLDAQKKYKMLSSHDMLTGLLNRPGMYTEVAEKLHPGMRVGVVMLDIDYFKTINDDYGHVVGDETLKTVSNLIRASLGDITCRWGGEEFVAICPGGAASLGVLNRLKENVEKAHYPFTENGRVLTISIGVYEADYTAHSQIDSFINNADVALYNAKENGRNRIEYYDPSAPKKETTAPKGTAQ